MSLRFLLTFTEGIMPLFVTSLGVHKQLKEEVMFDQRFTPHPWNPYLGNALILLTTHVLVATLQTFVTLPAHARLMYLASTLLLACIVVDDLHWRLVYGKSTPTPRPLLLAFMSLAVTTDYYVAALYILRSEALAVGSAVLLGVIIVGGQWWFLRSLHTGERTTTAHRTNN